MTLTPQGFARLYDGTLIAPPDLPSPTELRWTPRRKLIVVAAVEHGMLSLEDACIRYRLTLEEFLSWKRQPKVTGRRQ